MQTVPKTPSQGGGGEPMENTSQPNPRGPRVWAKIWQIHKNFLIAKLLNGDTVWVKRSYGFMQFAEPNDIIACYLEAANPPSETNPPPVFFCKYMASSPKLVAKKWTEPALHAAEVVQEIAETELKWGAVNADRVFRHGKEIADAGYTSTQITCAEKSDAH